MDINFVAVIVSSLAAFIIGFLFHGPLFGKMWMKLANITPTGNEKMSDMYGQMGMNLLANIVTAFVLAVLITLISESSFLFDKSLVCIGMIGSILVWAGVVVPGSSMDSIWMGKSWKLWIFECICSLVMLLAMGAILGAWI